MFLQNGSLPKLVGRRPKVSSRNSIRELNVCQMGRAYCPILDSFSKLSWALSDARKRQPSGLIHSRRHQTRSGTLRVPRSPLGICASSAIFLFKTVPYWTAQQRCQAFVLHYPSSCFASNLSLLGSRSAAYAE